MITRKAKAAEDTRTVARLARALSDYAATSPGHDVHVSVGHVQDLLNPRGLWSLDPDRVRALRTAPSDPDADPLTGCRPVTAQDETPE